METLIYKAKNLPSPKEGNSTKKITYYIDFDGEATKGDFLNCLKRCATETLNHTTERHQTNLFRVPKVKLDGPSGII